MAKTNTAMVHGTTDDDWLAVRLDADRLALAVDGVETVYRSADDIGHAIRDLEVAGRITPAVCGSMLAELDD